MRRRPRPGTARPTTCTPASAAARPSAAASRDFPIPASPASSTARACPARAASRSRSSRRAPPRGRPARPCPGRLGPPPWVAAAVMERIVARDTDTPGPTTAGSARTRGSATRSGPHRVRRTARSRCGPGGLAGRERRGPGRPGGPSRPPGGGEPGTQPQPQPSHRRRAASRRAAAAPRGTGPPPPAAGPAAARRGRRGGPSGCVSSAWWTTLRLRGPPGHRAITAVPRAARGPRVRGLLSPARWAAAADPGGRPDERARHQVSASLQGDRHEVGPWSPSTATGGAGCSIATSVAWERPSEVSFSVGTDGGVVQGGGPTGSDSAQGSSWPSRTGRAGRTRRPRRPRSRRR